MISWPDQLPQNVLESVPVPLSYLPPSFPSFQAQGVNQSSLLSWSWAFGAFAEDAFSSLNSPPCAPDGECQETGEGGSQAESQAGQEDGAGFPEVIWPSVSMEDASNIPIPLYTTAFLLSPLLLLPARSVLEEASASQAASKKETRMESSGKNKSYDVRIENFDVSFGER